MSLRLIRTEKSNGDTHIAKIYRNAEYDEYVVKFYRDGVYQVDADYFTDDIGDAISTSTHFTSNK
jgi:hypothetical protein